MKEPDFEFWRKERARILSKDFEDWREPVEVGNYLAAIDTILEVEPLIKFLRANQFWKSSL